MMASTLIGRYELQRLLTGLLIVLHVAMLPAHASGVFDDPVAPIERAEAAALDPGDDEPARLEVVEKTIVVTATRSERVAESLPISSAVLKREEIEQTPALTPDDVLRSIPGLILPQLNSREQIPSRNAVSMRGLGDGSVLVLIDGIPANDPFRGSPQWVRLGTETIDRVEVVRGATASLFGNYALGGTINMITRPVERSGLEFLGSYGSNGTAQVAARASYVPREGIGLALALERFETDGYERTARDVRGPIDIPFWSHQDNARFRLDLGTSPRLRTILTVGAIQNEISQGTPLSGNSTDLVDVANSGHMALGSTAALSWSAFFQDGQIGIRNVTLNAPRTAEQRAHISVSDVRSVGGSLQWSGSLGSRHPLISFGVDVRDADASDLREEFSNGTRRGTIFSGGGTRLAGVFAQTSWQPDDTLELLFSGRLDYWKNVDGYQQAIEGPRTFFREREQTQFDPKIAIRKQLSEAAAIRGSIYRGFHAPEIDQLYRSGGTRLRPVFANPNLEPETMTGADVGLVYGGGRSFVEVNAFWNRVRQNIGRVPLAGGAPGALIEANVGASRSRGFEVFGTRTLGSRLSFDGGYTYTESVVTEAPPSLPELEGNDGEDAPLHALTINAHFRPSDSLGVTVRGRYESESYPDTSNAVALDAATIIDLRIAYRLSIRTELFAICENLFDSESIAEVSPDNRYGPPRQVHGGVRMRFRGHH